MRTLFLLVSILFALSLAANAQKTMSEKFVGQVVCSNCWNEADRKTTP